MEVSIKDELDKLKTDRDELTRKITKLEKRLEYKSAGKIFIKIQKMVEAAEATGLKVVGINISDDVYRVLECDFTKHIRASVSWCLCGGETFIMGISVKIDRTRYETINLEVTVNE